MLYGFLVLFLLLAGLPPVMAATHVAIHATDVEVGIWQTRAVSGPYKSEWDILKARADRFVASRPARWAGNTTSTCYDGNAFSYGISRTQDMGLRDAAFVYFVQGGTSYLNAARTALLAQTAVAGTKFENGSKWCTSAADATNNGLGNTIGVWLRRLAYAYSYIKPALSGADQARLDTWFSNAGVYLYSVNHTLAAKRFPNRLSDVYGGCLVGCTNLKGRTHYTPGGGFTVYAFHEAWNNEGIAMNAAVAVIGVLVNNTTMKDHAVRFLHEWVKYATYSGGQVHDQARWGFGVTGGTPQHGFLYAGQSLGSALTGMDVLARNGYVNLFEYTTTVGLLGTESATPKGILTVMDHFAGLTNGTIIEYASKSATTNPNLRIDADGPTMRRIEFINLAHGNLFYQNAAVKTAYKQPVVAGYGTVGCDMLGSDWCHLPSVRFMYGALEGISMPYGGAAATEPDWTSNLTMHLRFDEGTLTTAEDSTANNHDGTLGSGATWGPAKMGASAVVLDGTANGIMTVTGELGTPAAVTLATWVKVSAFPTPTADVISIGDSVILRATATTVRGDYYTGTTWSNLSATRTLGTTDWHHLAFVVQAGTQQLYLDGAPVASGSNGAPIVYAGLGSNTILGGHGNGNVTNFRFQGTLDDVRVYSRALSATDIAGLAGLEGVP